MQVEVAAVYQGCNIWQQKTQTRANYRNGYLDQNLQSVETTAIQQICDRAFFRRGGRWIDGCSVASGRVTPDERIEFGSARFFALLQRLETQGRAGELSLRGEILLEVDGQNLLVTGSAEPEEAVR